MMTLQKPCLDRDLLGHTLRNLISNALKYSPQETTVTIELSYQSDGVLHFVIQDEGIGIPGDDLDELFCAFHRGSNVGEIEGTGLGMAITERCIKEQGGTIEVESTVNVGTTVTMNIPLN